MRDDQSPSVPQTDICDACARPLTDGCHLGVVRDSSAIHPRHRARDGRRLIAACSPEHLVALQREYRERPFVHEELGPGRSCVPWLSSPTDWLPKPYARPRGWMIYRSDAPWSGSSIGLSTARSPASTTCTPPMPGDSLDRWGAVVRAGGW
ncbi:hypothetical protein QMK19_23930 [Streptomyces sp. H10-C2]|uniref:hypothetical protein n=1 Tax=unclassified Streptomyces TaxID=2593676 RepID=UPI0024B8DEBB|nr:MULTISPECIES: hypothetical protein [unclassified Streptomyces]MDJ0342856.1 hypothetical protein [Streptomyces sp. PH10-H1]MDJ0372629.1 hypothetical protein [Streptomyces sp. H10-C2]